MFLVDTNIFVYAVNRQSPEHEVAKKVIGDWCKRADLWFATWPILYEFLRVVTHTALFEHPFRIGEAWSFVDSLLSVPGFSILVETDRHADVLRELAVEYPGVSGSLLHDFHTVALMREHGVREIRTADTDFHQFKFLRVVNPLAS